MQLKYTVLVKIFTICSNHSFVFCKDAGIVSAVDDPYLTATTTSTVKMEADGNHNWRIHVVVLG